MVYFTFRAYINSTFGTKISITRYGRYFTEIAHCVWMKNSINLGLSKRVHHGISKLRDESLHLCVYGLPYLFRIELCSAWGLWSKLGRSIAFCRENYFGSYFMHVYCWGMAVKFDEYWCVISHALHQRSSRILGITQIWLSMACVVLNLDHTGSKSLIYFFNYLCLVALVLHLNCRVTPCFISLSRDWIASHVVCSCCLCICRGISHFLLF